MTCIKGPVEETPLPKASPAPKRSPLLSDLEDRLDKSQCDGTSPYHPDREGEED